MDLKTSERGGGGEVYQARSILRANGAYSLAVKKHTKYEVCWQKRKPRHLASNRSIRGNNRRQVRCRIRGNAFVKRDVKRDRIHLAGMFSRSGFQWSVLSVPGLTAAKARLTTLHVHFAARQTKGNLLYKDNQLRRNPIL